MAGDGIFLLYALCNHVGGVSPFFVGPQPTHYLVGHQPTGCSLLCRCWAIGSRRGNCRLREPQSHFPFSFLFCTSKHKRHDKGNTFFSFCFGLRVTHKKGKRPRDWCAERSAWLNGNDRPRDDDEKAVMTYINSQEIGFWLMLAVWRCVRWESSARAQQCPIVSFPPLTQLESLFPKSCVRLFCCCCCYISALIAAASSPMDWFPVGRPKQCAPLSAVIDSVRWTQQLCWLCAQTRFVITCKHIRSTIPLP